MHPSMKLLIDNRKKGFFKVENAEHDEATIYLYGVIVGDEMEAEYWGGIAPESFVRALHEIKASTIHLRVNSPGGEVFAGRAMEQALREHPAKVIAHVDGRAASAASYVIMGADEIEITPGGFVMIHKGMTIAGGNSDDFLQVAAVLDEFDKSIVKTYVDRTGQSEEQVMDWIAAETWFNAEKAVEFGFVDRVSEVKTKTENLSWDLSAYEHAPKVEDKTQEPAPVAKPEPEPEPDPVPEYSTEHMNNLADRLRLAVTV